jgi:outer membrane protein
VEIQSGACYILRRPPLQYSSRQGLRLALTCIGAVIGVGLPLAPTAAVEPGGDQPAARVYIRLGPAGVLFTSRASLSVAGQEIPGASAAASNNVTATLDLGYFVVKQFAVSVTVGLPPTSSLIGTGTASAEGVLGQATYGPLVVSGHYHLTGRGIVQPYLGGGLAYYMVFGTRDGAITNLRVSNALGPVLQFGSDVLIGKRWGLFFDAKKIWLCPTASGEAPTSTGPAKAVAKVNLEPLVISAGVLLRF